MDRAVEEKSKTHGLASFILDRLQHGGDKQQVLPALV